MSQYTEKVIALRQKYNNAQNIKAQIDSLLSKISDMNSEYVVMLEAQQLLATISDNNTTAVLDYMTGVINKALSEIFPYDSRRIFLEKKLHNGQYAHINVRLEASNGAVRDMVLQSGTGLRQVVSFLFLISTIEIRKGRRLLIMDELLSGLHPNAKRVIMDIIQIFSEEGFQFIFVEYGVDDVGKIYLVEKPDDTAIVTPLGAEKYNNEVFVFKRPVEEVDLNVQVQEGDD